MRIFKKENLLLLFLATAIALSPRFSLGIIGKGRSFDIRVEDILLFILGLFWFINFLISGKRTIKSPPLFFPILIWLGVSFLSLLINWIFVNVGFSRGFFYFLKEVEFFFLYFYLFYHTRTRNAVKFVIPCWIFLGLLNVGWVVFQLLNSSYFRGYYGPGLVGEAGAFPTGGFFLIIFTALFNIFLYYYLNLDISRKIKIIVILCILSLTVGIFGSMSRASIFGLIVTFVLSLFIYFLKSKKLGSIFLSSVIFLIICGVFFTLSQKLPLLSQRMANFVSVPSLKERFKLWESYLLIIQENPLAALLGFGKSFVLKEGMIAIDNQYVRNFVETGILGSLFFLVLICFIIKKASQGLFSNDYLVVGLSAGLFVNTLVMLFVSLAAESFFVVRTAEPYWFFTALTLATLERKVKGQKYEFAK